MLRTKTAALRTVRLLTERTSSVLHKTPSRSAGVAASVLGTAERSSTRSDAPAVAAAAVGTLVAVGTTLFFSSGFQHPCTTRTEAAVLGSARAPVPAASTASDALGLVADDDDDDHHRESPVDDTTDVINWSGTHKVTVDNSRYWEPESVEEVEEIVAKCHREGIPLRPVGSSLSPNGLALNASGMIALAGLDRIVRIDTQRNTVTAQAGVTVNRVVEALRPHGLTLPNLASIAEQQMGGFTQVGAHGTGRCIAPVDDYVRKIKLVTPALGTVELTRENDGRLFELAKVGLGCLGVVVEVTMDCIPAHRLLEHTFVLTRQQAKEQLDGLLKKHKHMRYMWIPYTDTVVVVTNDPEHIVPANVPRKQSLMTFEEAALPLTSLLRELSAGTNDGYTEEAIKGMGFGELRDALLAYGPLDMEHVKRCNEAEAQFWQRSEGYQTKPSDELLQFDCGGQQWVFEVCFPTGTQEKDNGNDMDFMDRLLAGIERQGIPAHSPIEQRWSASSSSLMSPAHGPSDGMHSWVGIINYLPTDDERQRKQITDVFTGAYSDLVRIVGRPFDAVSHWAKLEKPKSIWRAVDLMLLMQKKYPLEEFNLARGRFDPKNILSNPLIDTALGRPEVPSDGCDDDSDNDGRVPTQ